MSGFLSNLLGGAPLAVSGGLSALLGVGPRPDRPRYHALAPPVTEAAREEPARARAVLLLNPSSPTSISMAMPSRVAQFTPDQQHAFEATRNLATQAGGLRVLTPELAPAGHCRYASVATTLPETDIAACMSPYTQGVIDPMVRARVRRNVQPRSASALGQQAAAHRLLRRLPPGDRGVRTEPGHQRNIAETTAAERAKAYNQALDEVREDQAAMPALYGAMQGQLARVSSKRKVPSAPWSIRSSRQAASSRRANKPTSTSSANSTKKNATSRCVASRPLRSTLGVAVCHVGHRSAANRKRPGPRHLLRPYRRRFARSVFP